MTNTAMVNFRIPEASYRKWQREAKRRLQTLSAFMRSCIDEECARAEAEESERAAWKSVLPASVRALVGILSAANDEVSDNDRREHYDHLEAKYA